MSILNFKNFWNLSQEVPRNSYNSSAYINVLFDLVGVTNLLKKVESIVTWILNMCDEMKFEICYFVFIEDFFLSKLT